MNKNGFTLLNYFVTGWWEEIHHPSFSNTYWPIQ